MKKTIALVAVLVLGVLGLACGNAATDAEMDNRKYDIVCYSGGTKIVEVVSASKVYYRQVSGTLVYTKDGKTFSITADCVVSNN